MSVMPRTARPSLSNVCAIEPPGGDLGDGPLVAVGLDASDWIALEPIRHGARLIPGTSAGGWAWRVAVVVTFAGWAVSSCPNARLLRWLPAAK
jgi:hypothetical protein